MVVRGSNFGNGSVWRSGDLGSSVSVAFVVVGAAHVPSQCRHTRVSRSVVVIGKKNEKKRERKQEKRGRERRVKSQDRIPKRGGELGFKNFLKTLSTN